MLDMHSSPAIIFIQVQSFNLTFISLYLVYWTEVCLFHWLEIFEFKIIASGTIDEQITHSFHEKTSWSHFLLAVFPIYFWFDCNIKKIWLLSLLKYQLIPKLLLFLLSERFVLENRSCWTSFFGIWEVNSIDVLVYWLDLWRFILIYQFRRWRELKSVAFRLLVVGCFELLGEFGYWQYFWGNVLIISSVDVHECFG